MFSNFPKKREPLPEQYEKIYVQEYKLNREGKTFITRLSMSLENWLHKQVVQKNKKGACILELGAGTLNHVPFENEFSQYDIVEPFSELYLQSSNKTKLKNIYTSIYDISYKKEQYDRILSIAVLEHVLDLPALIAYSALLLKEKGVFQASIPNQGALAWYITYNVTTGLAYYLRNRLNYNVLMLHEHVNTCYEIETILQYFSEMFL